MSDPKSQVCVKTSIIAIEDMIEETQKKIKQLSNEEILYKYELDQASSAQNKEILGQEESIKKKISHCSTNLKQLMVLQLSETKDTMEQISQTEKLFPPIQKTIESYNFKIDELSKVIGS